MTDEPLKRHPQVAGVILTGVGLLALSMLLYRFGLGGSTIPFLLGLFGLGIVLVAGVWYAALLLHELFWPSE